MKVCTKCKAVKRIDEFAADRSKKDGRKAQCKDCVATKARENYSSAERSKAYYKSSPQARSKRTIDRRTGRWKDLAAEHGEHWLIKEVQGLKAGGALSWEAIERADNDKRLATLLRQVAKTSPEALRTAFGPSSWDQVRGMLLTRADFVTRAMQRFVHAEGARAASLRVSFEKKWALWGMRPILDESDDAPAICQNTPTRREQRRAASDRVLRKK